MDIINILVIFTIHKQRTLHNVTKYPRNTTLLLVILQAKIIFSDYYCQLPAVPTGRSAEIVFSCEWHWHDCSATVWAGQSDKVLVLVSVDSAQDSGQYSGQWSGQQGDMRAGRWWRAALVCACALALGAHALPPAALGDVIANAATHLNTMKVSPLLMISVRTYIQITENR